MDKLRKLFLISQVFFLIVLRFTKMLLAARFQCREVYLKDWFGELGNNMVQIANASYVADRTNSPLYLPEHPFLNLEKKFSTHSFIPEKIFYRDFSAATILFHDLTQRFKDAATTKRSLVRNFFYQFDYIPFSIELTDYRRILRSQVFPLIDYQKDASVTDETLVIHIRSGDIFAGRDVHRTYVQPPVSFYLKIINEFDFKDVLIVTQSDFNNPCIHQLKQKVPGVRIQSSSLRNDVNTILSAQNLVAGVSTFSLALGFSSPEIKQLFIPQLEIKRSHWRRIFWSQIFKILFVPCRSNNNLDFQIRQLKIMNYIPIGDWQNSPAQQELMINHSDEYVLLNGTES